MSIVSPEQLAVVCFIWDDSKLKREYKPEYVDVLASMFARHLDVDHKIVCISGHGQRSFNHENVIALAPPPDVIRLSKFVTPEGPRFPTCYRRLWLFSEQAKNVIGDRILLTDVDVVITGNITSLVERDDHFVGWYPRQRWGLAEKRIAGGMYLMTAGKFTDVYEGFNAQSIKQARSAGYRGSDQAWISYKMVNRVSFWDDKKEGIWSVRDFKTSTLPRGARLVTFNGDRKPWDMLRTPWVKEHWQ